MKGYVIIAAVAAFLVSALTGPYLIRLLRRLKFGQKILEDGPTWHMKKQNTPTMGGFIFILGITVAVILLSVLVVPQTHDWRPVLMLGLSLLFGAVGFIDDWTKVKKKQNKGLTVVQKLLLQKKQKKKLLQKLLPLLHRQKLLQKKPLRKRPLQKLLR